MSRRLDGRVAIVTGADSGIGRAIATLFGGEGARVTVNYLNDRAGAEATVTAIEQAGGEGITLRADVGSEEQVDALFAACEGKFGPPDILVNNAARNSSDVRVLDMPVQQWEATLRTNLTGPFLCSRRFARGLAQHGHPGKIINITSVHEEMPAIGVADYCASKGGLRNLTRCLALELATAKINVNNIAPGTVLTAMNQDLLDDPKALAEHEQTIPWKRAATPDDIANLALFLASADSDYVTGATFVIDGGMLLNVGNGVAN
ncbi:MAG: short-chain dehydrogenase [Candidatus Eremiobacter antarcticus]|nr:SDR family oxidoreductase [Candidatus Eremiobacteraeota bacterium]PZR60885.1 MAG: short-chain dehydrogenase [Candidatus Eremiobacter sp. RRmetagenome_bin22]